MSNTHNIDQHLKTLEIVRTESNKWELPENDQRPCLIKLLEGDIPKGTRNITFHILACDFINRQKKSVSAAERILLSKNKCISAPLTEKELKGIIKSTTKKRMTYGCNTHPLILNYCIGKEHCSYFNNNFKRNKGGRTEGLYTLINLGWLRILSGNEFKVYASICQLEKIKYIVPGRVLIATHRDIQRMTGISRPTIAQDLIGLFFHKLILYKKGKRHKKYRTASEIARIVPIPHPTHKPKNLPNSCKDIYLYYKTSKKKISAHYQVNNLESREG